MNIDRHNYEEFFILYWDNELDPSQRKVVEEFVQENADLQEEFRLLGKTRFSPSEEIIFDSKELLVCTGSSLVDLSNYEQYLLSYVDDELNSTEKEELEKFLNDNPEIRKELALLSMTRIQPDLHIEFPDKSTLYRREERRPVITMVWFRIAAAAVVLLIAGYFTLQLINPGSETTGPVDNPVAVRKESKSGQKTSPNNVAPQANDNAVNDKDDRKKNDTEKKIDVKVDDKPQFVKNDQPKIDQKKDDQNKNDLPIIAQVETDQSTGTELPEINNKANKIDVAFNNPSINSGVTDKPTYALNIETPDQPAELEKDNGGLKGLLRKATRVFEKRTNIQATTDDNKLLVGAFKVSLK